MMRRLSDLLSDWEVIEMYRDWRLGVSSDALADRYGCTARSVRRMCRRVECAAREMGLEVRDG